MADTQLQSMIEMNQPFEGVMRFLPSKQQAEALLNEIRGRNTNMEAIRTTIRHQVPDSYSFSTPMMPPEAPRPPDPPVLTSKTSKSKLRRLKYSCEEIYERMDNGLCIFCDELDTPGHHNLKHKGVRIFMVECGDDRQVSDDKVLVPSVLDQGGDHTKILAGEQLSPPLRQNIEHLEGKHIQQLEFKSHVNFSSQEEFQEDSATLTKSSNDDELSFSQKDDRVWEPGGLPAKLCLSDWPDKEWKSHEKLHQNEMFSHPHMEVVKCGLEEFKIFNRERSNKTLYLEDEYEQKQVMKLISSWNNRIWEPGGVRTEFDKCKGLEKCYNHGTLMRLMQQWFSVWWQGIKFKESDRCVLSNELVAEQSVVKSLEKLPISSVNALSGSTTFNAKELGCEVVLEMDTLPQRSTSKSIIIDTLFKENICLYLKTELMLINGSRPRPPEPNESISVQNMELMQADETITKTDSGQAFEFQDTIVSNMPPNFVIQLQQIGSSIFQTQQTDFHVWHRWRNKADKVHAVSEFRPRWIVFYAESKKKMDTEDGINKALRKLLVFFSVHNMKLKAELELCISVLHISINQKLWVMYHHHLEINELSWFKKLQEMSSVMSSQKNPEIFIPTVGETQDWIINAWLKIQVFSDFALKALFGLKIYGCEDKKHILLLVKQANIVWERGRLLATHACWKWLENCHKRHRALACCFELEMSSVGYVEFKAYLNELLVAGLRLLNLAGMKFHLKHKWRTKLWQSLSVSGMNFHLKHKWRTKLWQSLSGLEINMSNNYALVRLKMVLALEVFGLILFSSKMFIGFYVLQHKNQTNQKLSSAWEFLLRLSHSTLHILVVEKNDTEIDISCCYGSHCDLDYTTNVTTGTFMEKFSSVCKFLLGAFILNFLAEPR